MSRLLNLDDWQKKMMRDGRPVDAVKDMHKKNPNFGLLPCLRVCEAYSDGFKDALKYKKTTLDTFNDSCYNFDVVNRSHGP